MHRQRPRNHRYSPFSRLIHDRITSNLILLEVSTCSNEGAPRQREELALGRRSAVYCIVSPHGTRSRRNKSSPSRKTTFRLRSRHQRDRTQQCAEGLYALSVRRVRQESVSRLVILDVINSYETRLMKTQRDKSLSGRLQKQGGDAGQPELVPE